ncbi:MAG: hypothetical protein EON98_08935 [Chitinophagaceae bacterium]|nr:MAG: hypothetical protein EON98_08935 [Chitinophagaceae bacterium]
MAENLPEVWLRGPIDGIPSLLQPATHALLQAVEEIKELMHDFPDGLLWEKPANVASPGFHLLHIKGVLDRLATYAQGNALSEAQLTYLRSESEQQENYADHRCIDLLPDRCFHRLHFAHRFDLSFADSRCFRCYPVGWTVVHRFYDYFPP